MDEVSAVRNDDVLSLCGQIQEVRLHRPKGFIDCCHFFLGEIPYGWVFFAPGQDENRSDFFSLDGPFCCCKRCLLYRRCSRRAMGCAWRTFPHASFTQILRVPVRAGHLPGDVRPVMILREIREDRIPIFSILTVHPGVERGDPEMRTPALQTSSAFSPLFINPCPSFRIVYRIFGLAWLCSSLRRALRCGREQPMRVPWPIAASVFARGDLRLPGPGRGYPRNCG
jgi:hypothetical protein